MKNILAILAALVLLFATDEAQARGRNGASFQQINAGNGGVSATQFSVRRGLFGGIRSVNFQQINAGGSVTQFSAGRRNVNFQQVNAGNGFGGRVSATQFSAGRRNGVNFQQVNLNGGVGFGTGFHRNGFAGGFYGNRFGFAYNRGFGFAYNRGFAYGGGFGVPFTYNVSYAPTASYAVSYPAYSDASLLYADPNTIPVNVPVQAATVQYQLVPVQYIAQPFGFAAGVCR